MTAPIAELLAPIKEALPRVGEPESTWCMVQGSDLRALIAAVEALQALAGRLKLEAQIHAQEARTANATIAECYRVVTGATGEPGNWNGAEPVRKAFAALAAERDALRAAVLFALPIAEQEWGGGIGHNTIGEQAIELLRDAARTQEPT